MLGGKLLKGIFFWGCWGLTSSSCTCTNPLQMTAICGVNMNIYCILWPNHLGFAEIAQTFQIKAQFDGKWIFEGIPTWGPFHSPLQILGKWIGIGMGIGAWMMDTFCWRPCAPGGPTAMMAILVGETIGGILLEKLVLRSCGPSFWG
jgi:hypothetical protein